MVSLLEIMKAIIETVKWFKIQYLKNEAKALLKDRYYRLKADNKTSNQQLSLF